MATVCQIAGERHSNVRRFASGTWTRWKYSSRCDGRPAVPAFSAYLRYSRILTSNIDPSLVKLRTNAISSAVTVST